MSTLEQALKDGRKNLNEIVDSWEKVIIDFANTFGIKYPKSKRNETFDFNHTINYFITFSFKSIFHVNNGFVG